MKARLSLLATFSTLSLLAIPSPSRSAQPAPVTLPPQPDPSTNETMPLVIDIDITSKRLDEARQQIQPSLGATKYRFDEQIAASSSAGGECERQPNRAPVARHLAGKLQPDPYPGRAWQRAISDRRRAIPPRPFVLRPSIGIAFRQFGIGAHRLASRAIRD